MKLISSQNQSETRLAASSARMAVVGRARVAAPVATPIASVIPAAPLLCALHQEGEDALLNGMTRSLQRRLFGLNIPQMAVAKVQSNTSLDVPGEAKAA